MTTLIQREGTDTREFHVPFGAPIPSVPFGEGELVIETHGPEARPVRVALRLFPTALELQARLPALAGELGMADSVFQLGQAAAQAQAVLEYEADTRVVARVPAGLATLADMAGYLLDEVALFDMREYRLVAISFSSVL
jgi:hypothetical protein